MKDKKMNEDWKKELSAQVKEINDQLIHLHNKNDKVLVDGVLNFERYVNAKKRILWVLKQDIDNGQKSISEAIELYGDQYIRSSPTWRRLAQVSTGILTSQLDFDKIKPMINEELRPYLQSTAIIEVQKNKGESTTSVQTVQGGFETYKDLIFRQIKAYLPDIMIVCWGEEALKPITEQLFQLYTGVPYRIDWSVEQREANVAVTKQEENFFLWTTHPSYFKGIKDADFFDTIMRAVNNTARKL